MAGSTRSPASASIAFRQLNPQVGNDRSWVGSRPPKLVAERIIQVSYRRKQQMQELRDAASTDTDSAG